MTDYTVQPNATLAAKIKAAAEKYGVPVSLFQNQINKESSFDPNALGAAGEIGYAQILPATANLLPKMGWKGKNVLNPDENLDAGAFYLSKLKEKFGNWGDALTAYNAGNITSTAGRAYSNEIISALDAETKQAVLGDKFDPNSADNIIETFINDAKDFIGKKFTGETATINEDGSTTVVGSLSTPLGTIGKYGLAVTVTLILATAGIALLAFSSYREVTKKGGLGEKVIG